MNSLSGPPARCPASTMVLSAELPSICECWLNTLRIWVPTTSATRNMVGAVKIVSMPSTGWSMLSWIDVTTAWVTARLPAVISTMMRSSGADQVCILRYLEMLSSPALVRVSDRHTRPSSTFRATQ